jgi:hypothetical protein
MAEEKTDNNIVIDHGQSQWSDLWKKEDFLAIWVGLLVIAVCCFAYFTFAPKEEFSQKIEAANGIQQAEAARAPFKTHRLAQGRGRQKEAQGVQLPFGKFATHWTKHPGGWTTNPWTP